MPETDHQALDRGIGFPGSPVFTSRPEDSRGRLFSEPESASRSVFQRDRDRIVHSTAFRRLTYKTQVFVYHEGDHFRTRLTHTLEVAQIARTIARRLGGDEDLAEAIALAHDLGHPPFGHAGERALDEVMRAHGGFDHNAQSLRLVTRLERRYAAFDGLNLTWETLEGLVKHNGPLLSAAGAANGRYAERGVPPPIVDYDKLHDLALDTHPSLEAQIAALADDIAYNNHDIDDGIRAGMFGLDELAEVPLATAIVEEVRGLGPGLGASRQTHETVRRLMTAMIQDALAETARRLDAVSPTCPDDLRAAGRPVVAFSPEMGEAMDELRFFLLSWMYRHPRINRIMAGAQRIVRDLYGCYATRPQALPEEWRSRFASAEDAGQPRAVADFVAGMTDRYAIGEHRRLFDDTPVLR